jgi:hypothetical protein
MDKSTSKDPVLALDLFLLLSVCQWWDHVTAFESLQYNVILRSAEVHQAISSVITLGTGRGCHPVDVGSQHSVCELDHRVAEVDDGMTGKWFDVAPLRVSSGWKDLEATKAIEEDSDTAEVGVLAKCDTPVVDGLWWRFDESDLVPTDAV